MLKNLHLVHASNKKPFRTIPFYEGLNIVLADRAKKSGQRGTRNGVGKSTLIEIIDFCLGAEPNRDNTLQIAQIPGWTFILELEVRGTVLTVHRSSDDPDKIVVVGCIEKCPVTSQVRKLDGSYEYNPSAWRTFLGWALFNVDPTAQDETSRNAPQYASLICHFIRKVFDNPLGALPGEYRSRTELAITFLLGLDAVFLQKARDVKKERKDIESRRSAAQSQALEWVRDIQYLKGECKRMKQQLEERKAVLGKFSTKDEVAAINAELSSLTDQYHATIKRRTANERKLKIALRSQQMPYVPFDSVKHIYEEAGALFSHAAIKHMEDVKKFHEVLQANYKGLIEKEIDRLRKEIAEDGQAIENIDGKRVAAIAAQNSRNAFEEYAKLQENLMRCSAELAIKEDCLKRYEKARRELDENTRKRDELIDDAVENQKRLQAVLDAEEEFFRQFINTLYQDADEITLGVKIEKGDNFGISYAPHFSSDRSMGKRKLKTLGFDLTMFDHQRRSGGNIDFMIHDSVLYESSDSRQFATALLFVDALCRDTHSQYITVLNSDDAQTDDFTSAIDFKDLTERFVKDRVLTDDGPSGKLLGMDF